MASLLTQCQYRTWCRRRQGHATQCLRARVIRVADDRDLHRPVEQGADRSQPPSTGAWSTRCQIADDGQCLLGHLPVLRNSRDRRIGRAGVGDGEPAGGLGTVCRVSRAVHQGRGVVGGVEEAAESISEMRNGDVEQHASQGKPAVITAHLEESQEALGDVAVVVEHAVVLPRHPIARGSTQTIVTVRAEVHCEQEVSCAIGSLDPGGLIQQRAGLGQGRDRQAIPGRHHLVIAARAHPGLAILTQSGAQHGPTLLVVRIPQQLKGRRAVLKGAGGRDVQQCGGPRAVLLAQH